MARLAWARQNLNSISVLQRLAMKTSRRRQRWSWRRRSTKTTRRPWNSTSVDSQSTFSSVTELLKTHLKSVTSLPLTTWSTKEKRKSRQLSTLIHSIKIQANHSAKCRSTQLKLNFPRCSARVVDSADKACQNHIAMQPRNLTTTHWSSDSDNECVVDSFQIIRNQCFSKYK